MEVLQVRVQRVAGENVGGWAHDPLCRGAEELRRKAAGANRGY